MPRRGETNNLYQRGKAGIWWLHYRGVRRSLQTSDIGLARAKRAEVVKANADLRSHLRTDEAKHYVNLGREFASHEAVQHSAKEYVRKGDGPTAHTNTIEGFFSVFKRGMKGTYQHCGERHLHRYLAEFDFRYNTRSALGVEDAERAMNALAGAKGKRLRYRSASDAA